MEDRRRTCFYADTTNFIVPFSPPVHAGQSRVAVTSIFFFLLNRHPHASEKEDTHFSRVDAKD